jgi:hypothetical protein
VEDREEESELEEEIEVISETKHEDAIVSMHPHLINLYTIL